MDDSINTSTIVEALDSYLDLNVEISSENASPDDTKLSDKSDKNDEQMNVSVQPSTKSRNVHMHHKHSYQHVSGKSREVK